MSEINFLPAEQKAKEALEEKQNILAKENASVKFSSPATPVKPAPAFSQKPAKPGFLASLKGLFSKKQKPPLPKPVAPKPFSGNGHNGNPVPPSPAPVSATAPKPIVPESRGFMAPINASAWVHQNQPVKKEEPAPVAVPKVEVPVTENKNNFTKNEPSKSNGLGARLPNGFSLDKSRREIEINLISSEGHFREMSPRAKLTIFLAVTIGIALIFSGIFFFIDFKVKKTMNEKVAVENSIVDTKAKIAEANKNNKAVSELQPQLENLAKILGDQPRAHLLFDYLETNTTLGVYYEEMSIDVETKQLSLSGVALDYSQTAQQFLIFNNDKEHVALVELSGLSKTLEKLTEQQENSGLKPREIVSFELTLTLADGFFK